MRIIKIFIIIFLLILSFFYIYPGFHAYRSQQKFIKKWCDNFIKIKNIEGLNQNEETNSIVSRKFDNEEWIVAISNESQTGSPFALVMRDSNNYLYVSTFKDSNNKTLKNEFVEINTNSLNEFIIKFSKKYQLEKLK
jgi:hypothetical protein